ncbi:hypothetical protein PR048_033261 [Dryococelus australis]|uniref:C2H2-type domain-containing protein n=1 Tax=Dryococelus australis TaxID=614101 RepID=A0ABQ9FZT2_9NEOP|nr:hypothetical protein PR048_033261 [Dryococelus australis]
MPLIGGFSWGYPDISPPSPSGADPYSPRFTLIGSQDFDVKSLPNLFTHSPYGVAHSNPKLLTDFEHEIQHLEEVSRGSFPRLQRELDYESLVAACCTFSAHAAGASNYYRAALRKLDVFRPLSSEQHGNSLHTPCDVSCRATFWWRKSKISSGRVQYGAKKKKPQLTLQQFTTRHCASTQETDAPFEFRAGVEIEIKFISNRRNWWFEISIRDQQTSLTNMMQANDFTKSTLWMYLLSLLEYSMENNVATVDRSSAKAANARRHEKSDCFENQSHDFLSCYKCSGQFTRRDNLNTSRLTNHVSASISRHCDVSTRSNCASDDRQVGPRWVSGQAARLPPTRTVSFPGEVDPEFSHVVIVPGDAAFRRVL